MMENELRLDTLKLAIQLDIRKSDKPRELSDILELSEVFFKYCKSGEMVVDTSQIKKLITAGLAQQDIDAKDIYFQQVAAGLGIEL